MNGANALHEATFSVIHDRPADPGAGTVLTRIVDTNARQMLSALRVTVTTDATVADRLLYINYQDSTGQILSVQANQIQTAGTAVTYNFALGLDSNPSTVVAGEVMAPLPDTGRLYFPGQWTLSLHGFEVGDEISDAVFTIRSWMSG